MRNSFTHAKKHVFTRFRRSPFRNRHWFKVIRMALKDLLVHPMARGLDLDDPTTTMLRRDIIRDKGFLRKLYDQWYRDLTASLPHIQGPVLEIGSGAGFLAESLPGLVTSDIFFLPYLSLVFDAASIPFDRSSLRALVMIDVLHHLPEPRRFFSEAARCVKPGGAIVMIEPWVTSWSRFVYSRFHHEPFEPESKEWEFPPSGPLSGANGALPWIIFQRDRRLFETSFPEWTVSTIRLGTPMSYILSGGMTMRSLLPGTLFRQVQWVERLLGPWMQRIALFAQIVLTRA